MMKLHHIVCCFAFAALITACGSSKKILSYPNQVVALPNTEEGTILIRSTGTGNTELDAVTNAETKAFNTVMFKGLPSSTQVRPLVENEQESLSRNDNFYKGFFNNNGYKNYVVSSVNYTGVEKSQGLYYVNRDVKINIRSLRTYLETNNIIRKFGY